MACRGAPVHQAVEAIHQERRGPARIVAIFEASLGDAFARSLYLGKRCRLRKKEKMPWAIEEVGSDTGFPDVIFRGQIRKRHLCSLWAPTVEALLQGNCKGRS